MMKFLSLMLLVLAVSCSPYPQDGKASAVLISVSLTYEGSPEYVNRLLCTANDSRAVEEEMKLLAEASGMDFELHKFTDEGNGAGGSRLVNTESNIVYDRDGLLSYIKGIGTSPGDIIIFYFSGHGIAVNGESMIVVDPECKEDDFLALSDISDALSSLDGDSCMIIDACQSGSETESELAGEVFSTTGDYIGTNIGNALSSAFRLSFSARPPEDDVYILASCTENQNSLANMGISGAINSGKYSVFTYYMLSYLGYDFAKEKADLPSTGMITFYSIYQGIKDSMADEFWEKQTAQPVRTPIDLILFSFI